jgi:hypothetical protein
MATPLSAQLADLSVRAKQVSVSTAAATQEEVCFRTERNFVKALFWRT